VGPRFHEDEQLLDDLHWFHSHSFFIECWNSKIAKLEYFIAVHNDFERFHNKHKIWIIIVANYLRQRLRNSSIVLLRKCEIPKQFAWTVKNAQLWVSV
jgi:hypothetical protein